MLPFRPREVSVNWRAPTLKLSVSWGGPRTPDPVPPEGDNAAAVPDERPAPRTTAPRPATTSPRATESTAAPAPPPAAPSLRVESDVPGAMVFLNRKYLGTTPLVSREVTPGSHQLNVQVDPGRLTISGERSFDQGEECSYHRRERSSGRFARTIQLPRDLDPEKANAQYRNGLLTVHIPKHASAKPRQIQVQAA